MTTPWDPTTGSDDGVNRPTTEHNETVERILRGALAAVTRHGVRKLSMSDIATHAEVSRGTLYRYFSSKEHVLESVGDYVRSCWVASLKHAVEADPDPAHRVRVVLRTVLRMAEEIPEAKTVFEGDPVWAFSYLQRNFPTLVAAVAESMEPVIAAADVVRAGVLTGPQLAEIFLRTAMAGFLIPTGGTAGLPDRVDILWRFVNDAAVAERLGSSRPDLRLVEDAALVGDEDGIPGVNWLRGAGRRPSAY